MHIFMYMVIDCGIAVWHMIKEAEWTTHPYGLNGIIEDKHWSKSGKGCEYLIGKAVPRLARIGS